MRGSLFLFHIQPLPLVPRLFVPSVACPGCANPNDRDFRFCQCCGYQRQRTCKTVPAALRAPVDLSKIETRKQYVLKLKQSSSYAKQKSSLETEFLAFLDKTTMDKDISTATPDDIVNFLVWKDQFGKTIVHQDACPFFGHKEKSSCQCPRRLAYGTLDSLVGKLRAIFSQGGRTIGDAVLPGYGNPAASLKVKSYLSAVKEEQLLARTIPTQAEPFFIQDLAAISTEIFQRLSETISSPVQLFLLARDQAFFKTLFFAGDRAGDLGRVKTKEMLYFPQKEGLLFNHFLTKSLRDGTSNLFAIKRYKEASLCPVVAIETYIRICDLIGIPIRQGFLFRPINPSGEIMPTFFDSSAAQARLSVYTQQLPHIFGGRRTTLHGMSGCAISLALSGTDLGTIMDHVGWKTTSTARHYIKLNQVLHPGGAGDTLAGISMDLAELFKKQNNLTGFSQAF